MTIKIEATDPFYPVLRLELFRIIRKKIEWKNERAVTNTYLHI